MHAPDEIALFAGRFNAIGVEYMITGATAAIVYGQPRLTNDLDVVLALRDRQVPDLIAAFPEAEFYVPPESVIRTERSRSLRGHFNILHLASGFKADIYLVGNDPLHLWALPLRRQIDWSDGMPLHVAPPEYVIVRKLEYFREGGSSKHPADISTRRGCRSRRAHRLAVSAFPKVNPRAEFSSALSARVSGPGRKLKPKR